MKGERVFCPQSSSSFTVCTKSQLRCLFKFTGRFKGQSGVDEKGFESEVCVKQTKGFTEIQSEGE